MGISQMPLVFWNFLFRNISQYEYTDIDTFIGGGHVPAWLFWSTSGVSVSIKRDMISKRGSKRSLTWMITRFWFRVIDLKEICTDRCEASHLQCILNCPSNNFGCLSQCIREESECFNGKFFIEIIFSVKVESFNLNPSLKHYFSLSVWA